jgi:hypothetical protein
LRLVIYDLSKDFFQRLAVCSDDPPLPSHEPCISGMQEPLPTESQNAATEGTVLDAAALRSLQQMFLLLDEWDRAMTNSPSSTQHSSKGRETNG